MQNQNQYGIFYKEINIDPAIIEIFHSKELYRNVHKTLTARALKIGITCYWRTYHDASLYEISDLIEFEKEIDSDHRIFTFVPTWVNKLELENLNKSTASRLLKFISKELNFPIATNYGCYCGKCVNEEIRIKILQFLHENKDFRETFLNDLCLSSL